MQVYTDVDCDAFICGLHKKSNNAFAILCGLHFNKEIEDSVGYHLPAHERKRLRFSFTVNP